MEPFAEAAIFGVRLPSHLQYHGKLHEKIVEKINGNPIKNRNSMLIELKTSADKIYLRWWWSSKLEHTQW